MELEGNLPRSRIATFRIDAELLAFVEAYAEALQTSRGSIIRDSLRRVLLWEIGRRL